MGFKIFRIVLQALGLLVLLAVTVFILSRWAQLPAELPTRFDAAGQPTSYGDRSSLVSLLVVLCGNRDAQPVVNSGSLY